MSEGEPVRMKLRSSRTMPTLHKIQPEIPTEEEELEELRVALSKMGCAGLLEVPWGVKEETLIRDLVGPVPNTWDNTLRGHPEEWTLAVWREVYGFRKAGGVWIAERVDEYLDGEFRNAPDPKDGYTVRDLKDPVS